MKSFSLRWETVLYLVAFLLGLSLRLVAIGRLPLTDAEATLALQAAAVARGEDVLLSPQPGYLSLTALLMFLTRASDWTARFWPALAGSLMIFTPLFFRRWIGRFPANVLAFGLAIDPGLLAAARTADGLTLAMLGVVAAAGFAIHGKPAWSGIAAGLALLSGPSVWPGLLGAAGAVLLTVWRKRGEAGAVEEPPASALTPARRTFLLYLLGTLFFVGTLFFFLPRGLGAMAGSLPSYLTGWGRPGVPAGQFLAFLLSYEFFPLLLGLWAAVEGLRRGNRLDRFLVVWWVLSLVLAVINPGRQVIDIGWSILAFGTLAARQVARAITLPETDRLPMLGQGLLAALMLGFLSITVLSFVNNWQVANRDETLIRAAGALFLLVASAGLIGWGWSRSVTLRGLSLGALLMVVIFAVSTGWYSAGLSARSTREAWSARQSLPDRALLLRTLDDLRQWGKEPQGPYELVVVAVPSPALRWALRDDPNVRYVDGTPRNSSPGLVIAPEQLDPGLSAAYRGQALVLAEQVDWTRLRPHEWLRWLAFRVVPDDVVQRERIILWARGDLFPGGTLLPEAAPPETGPAPEGVE